MDYTDEGFYNWLSSESAVPYLQKMGIDPSRFARDPYQRYLDELLGWISANPSNPTLQNAIAEQYLSILNPATRQDMDYQKRIDDINAAIALIELGRDDLAAQFLGGYGYTMPGMSTTSPYGVGGSTFGGETGTSGYLSNLSGYQTQALKNIYGPKLEKATDPEKMALYSTLASGSPDVVSKYYEEVTPMDKAKAMDWWMWLLPGLSLFQTEKKTREEKVKNAYGL